MFVMAQKHATIGILAGFAMSSTSRPPVVTDHCVVWCICSVVRLLPDCQKLNKLYVLFVQPLQVSDSLQVYPELNLGVFKATLQELVYCKLSFCSRK